MSRSTRDLLDQPFQFEVDQRLEFPRSRLLLEETLGEGEFGRVVGGRALNLPPLEGHTRWGKDLAEQSCHELVQGGREDAEAAPQPRGAAGPPD